MSPTAPNLVNDLNFLNSILKNNQSNNLINNNNYNNINNNIFNNINNNMNNIREPAKFNNNQEVEELAAQIKALNNMDSINRNNGNNFNNIQNCYAQNLIKGNDLKNINDSLFLHFLSPGVNNNNNINQNNQLFLYNSLNQIACNPKIPNIAQNFWNSPPSLNFPNSTIASTNNVLNYLNNHNTNSSSNSYSNFNSKANYNSLNMLNKNSTTNDDKTIEDKTSEADPKNAKCVEVGAAAAANNNSSANIAIDNPHLNNLKNLLTHPDINQHLNSMLQMQNQSKIEINKVTKTKAEEQQMSSAANGLEKILNKNPTSSTREFTIKNQKDFPPDLNDFNNKNTEKLLLAYQANGGNNDIKQHVPSLQYLNDISKMYNMFNSSNSYNEQSNNHQGNKEEIIYFEKADNNHNSSTNQFQNKILAANEPSNSLLVNKNGESFKNVNKIANKINKNEALNGNIIQELNTAPLIDLNTKQQNSSSFEPFTKEDDMRLEEKKNLEKEAQKDGFNQCKESNQCSTNLINLPQSKAQINPLILKLIENLTYQINNIPLNPNRIDEEISNIDINQKNQNKAFANLINLNQIENTSPIDTRNNDLMMNIPNNILNFEDFLNNDKQPNHYQDQLNINNTFAFATENDNDNITNNTNNNSNINIPDDLQKLENFVQEYMKNFSVSNQN